MSELKGTPIMACVDGAVNELNEIIDRVAEELAGEQKANGKSQQAESPTVLEAIERAREAMCTCIDTRVHFVINSWLDYIEKAAKGKRRTWHQDDTASDAALQKGYYSGADERR